MPRNVLIIDDSQDVHELVHAWLSGEPIELHSAFDGNGGLQMAASVPADLVLLDVDLPGLNGFETCVRLKSEAATMGIPVIFLTGSHTTEDKIRGLELGAVDYITKPFDPAELRARVRASLRTKHLMDLLARKAQIDGLTGLWNRAYLDTRVNAETSLARRIGRPLTCIMTDVDHFKRVNDTYGHSCGDEVLCAVVQSLLENCREEDVVCRYGGEEFAILLPNTGAGRGLELAERCRRSIAAQQFRCRNAMFQVTASFGLADLDSAADGGLVDTADRALYLAKQLGRNRCVDARNDEALPSGKKMALSEIR